MKKGLDQKRVTKCYKNGNIHAIYKIQKGFFNHFDISSGVMDS